MKRAQSMGVNIVIIAAIALLVLVIIAIMVSGAGRGLWEGTQSCEVQGGYCATFPDNPRHQPIEGECQDNMQCYRVVGS